MGYEPGRSTAGITATLRKILGKAAEWGIGAFVASADVEGAFDSIRHMDIERALLQKGVRPSSICALLRESCDLKGRINLPGAPMSSPFPYDRGARQGSVEGPDMWNQVLDNALREPAARSEAEGIGFKLATEYRRKKNRRTFSGADTKGADGPVLHHLCWADDLYAMAGSIEHLIRILTDMTNAVEKLHMKWKESSLKIVAGPYTNYKSGQKIEIVSMNNRKYNWHVVDGMEALGTWPDNRGSSEASLWHRISKGNSMFYAKKILFCDSNIPVHKRIDTFYSTGVPAVLHGAGEWAYTQGMFHSLRTWELDKLRRILCLRRRPHENWVDYMKRTGLIVAKQLKKHN